MATPHRFRSAVNGFNRTDVVNYIEYLNNRYNAQLEQLNNQLQEARNAVAPESTKALQDQLDAALQRCAELEAKLNDQNEAHISKELEAYRRAEEAERKANARAQEVYNQANAVLSGATAMAESATEELNQVAERTARQLQEYQAAIAATAESFKNAAASLGAVKAE